MTGVDSHTKESDQRQGNPASATGRGVHHGTRPFLRGSTQRIAKGLRAQGGPKRFAYAILALAAGLAGGLAESSLDKSTLMLAKVLYWVVSVASFGPFLWCIEIVRASGRWLGWALLGNGLVMLVVASMAWAYPAVEEAPSRALSCSLVSGVLLVSVGGMVLLRGLSRPSRSTKDD